VEPCAHAAHEYTPPSTLRWWFSGHKHWFAVSGILVEPVGHATQSDPSW
jgi:hypothetical protein